MVPAYQKSRSTVFMVPEKGVLSSVVLTVHSWCLDWAAWSEGSSTHEVPRLQKFCRRNLCMFLAPRKSECQLTAESAECCRTRGNSHLPSREAPVWTATGEPGMPLWTWHALAERIIVCFLCVVGIKPFVCLICNTTFTRQHSLNYHMLIHKNLNRFTCKECGRMFRHPSHYKVVSLCVLCDASDLEAWQKLHPLPHISCPCPSSFFSLPSPQDFQNSFPFPFHPRLYSSSWQNMASIVTNNILLVFAILSVNL